MSTAKPLPLRLGIMAAERLRAELAQHCERIEIAGSIRRGKPQIGDIELVAIPRVDRSEQRDLFGTAVTTREHNYLDAHLRHMLRKTPPSIYKSRADLFSELGLLADGVPDVLRWGERYKRFYFLWASVGAIIPVDLFLASADNWGAILTIRTGPGDFSTALVTHLKHATPYRQMDGQLVIEATGEAVPVPEEADYFQRAGVPYIEPQHRNVPMLRRAIQAGA